MAAKEQGRPGVPSPEVDAILAEMPDDRRAALEHLRATIRAVVPDAVEVVGYGVPAFKYRGRPLVSFGAGKDHCSFYVQSPAVMDAHRALLEGFSTARGTVHFQPGHPPPDDLVRTLVRARVAETDAAARKG